MAVNFNLVARPYRWMEYLSFGPFLSRCRNTFLANLSGSRHALVLGDGDGRFLNHLLKENLQLTADVVDSSQTMLRVLENRLGPACQRIQAHLADAVTWNPTGSYDLIITHFFLDCFFQQQLEQLLNQLLPHARSGARWVISEFAIPANPVLAPFAKALISLLYSIFKLFTGLPVRQLPDYATALQKRGFVLLEERLYLGGLLCAQLWSRPSD